MGKISKNVQEAGLILSALGVLGFLGIVWLMIYGNLSGNLGFEQDSTFFFNETINLTTEGVDGSIPATAQNRVNPSLTNVIVTNASTGEIITTGNYSLTIVTFRNITADYGGQLVNISAVVTYDSVGKANTESVINNLTAAFLAFFGFSNTFFIIAAIILLIIMLVGLLGIVMAIAEGRKSKSTGFE